MIVRLVKRSKNKSCFYCDNIIDNQEYLFDSKQYVFDFNKEGDKVGRRLLFWKDNVGYYTDTIIRIEDNCYHSAHARYYVNES